MSGGENQQIGQTARSRPDVQIREAAISDFPILYEFQLDPVANEIAALHPRTAEEFWAHRTAGMTDPDVIARTILADGKIAGSIAVFKTEGLFCVGYWIGTHFWGQGIATRALALLLEQVTHRPLYAHVAVQNIASLRVLQKCGFIEIARAQSPATERWQACEEIEMRLE